MIKKIVLFVLSVLLGLAVLGLACIAGAAYLSGSEKDNKVLSPLKENMPRLEAPLTILVAGLDKGGFPDGPPRPGPWRTDVLILVLADPEEQLVSCISIPRDTRAEIPGHGRGKIAHAHAYGAMPLTIKSVEGLTGIKVDHYLTIDYAAFARLVDIMGGIEVEVSKELKTKYFVYEPGMQLLNGQQAYLYVSSRNEPLADIARIDRQQQFLRALLLKLGERPVAPPEMLRLFVEFKKGSGTSLSAGDAFKLLLFARQVGLERTEFHTLPGAPEYVSGVSYWVPDLKSLRLLIPDAFRAVDFAARVGGDWNKKGGMINIG